MPLSALSLADCFGAAVGVALGISAASVSFGGVENSAPSWAASMPRRQDVTAGKLAGYSTLSNLAYVGCLLVPLFLTGCYAGAAALVLGVVALSGGGDGKTMSPLRVRDMETSPYTDAAGEVLGRDELRIEFTLSGGHDGILGARVEYWILPAGGDVRVSDDGPYLATLQEGPNPISPIRRDEVVQRTWDARTDLEDRNALVRVVVHPLENGKEGEAAAQILPAGNTPPLLESVLLGLAENRLLANFVVRDAESNPVAIERLSIAWIEEGEDFSGAEYIPLPDPVFLDEAEFPLNQRRGLPSNPAGARSGLSLRLAALSGTPLGRLAEPGFVGLVKILLAYRDFPREELREADSLPFRLDTNDPPELIVLPNDDPDRLRSGVIPIRYRVSDRQGNHARLAVEVDLGEGFRRAHEFPLAASDAIGDLPTDDPTHTFTFLWDALSQLRETPAGSRQARLRLCAADREENCVLSSELSLALSWLTPAGGFETGRDPVALQCGDFDGDGFSDLAVANRTSDSISTLRGSPRGLQPAGGIQLPAGSRPTALAGGDFNNDGKHDVLAANSFADSVSLLVGSSEGLACGDDCMLELPDARMPSALLVTHLDGDAFLDAAVANLTSNNVSILQGGPGGLKWVKNLPADLRPAALTAGDFNRSPKVNVGGFQVTGDQG